MKDGQRRPGTVAASSGGVRTTVASLAVLSALAALPVLCFSRPARADRYYVVYDERHDLQEVRSGPNIGLDLEGAAPLAAPRFLSGNNLSGGGGFKIRVGDQIRFPFVRLTPEGGYTFDHLFATDDIGNAYAWDMHRLFGGLRVGFGRLVVPGFYSHLGYGWRDTGDPTVRQASGLAFDAGGFLDIHVIPHVGLGAHVEYAMIDAQPYTPHWVAFGLHTDIVF